VNLPEVDVAVDDVEILRTHMPELFEADVLTEGWETDFIVLPDDGEDITIPEDLLIISQDDNIPPVDDNPRGIDIFFPDLEGQVNSRPGHPLGGIINSGRPGSLVVARNGGQG
jgi:hypothetical protein